MSKIAAEIDSVTSCPIGLDLSSFFVPSMRDDTQVRGRDVVKVRNVLLEADADADYLTR